MRTRKTLSLVLYILSALALVGYAASFFFRNDGLEITFVATSWSLATLATLVRFPTYKKRLEMAGDRDNVHGELHVRESDDGLTLRLEFLKDIEELVEKKVITFRVVITPEDHA